MKTEAWKALHLGMTLILLLAMGAIVGCGREACYARNDAAFLEVVEDCETAGFSYEGCPWIPEAERIQEERDRMCP